MCTLGCLGGRFLFKNRDMDADVCLDEDVFRGEGLHAYVGVRGHVTPRERGLNSGINDAGVAAAITYVGDVPLAVALGRACPRGVLVEEVLRTAGSLREAELVANYLLLANEFVGGTITVASPEGSFVVEEAEGRFSINRVGLSDVVRTNHFRDLAWRGGTLSGLANSRVRCARMEGLVAGIEREGASVDAIERALADHENGADAICRHGGAMVTVSSAVYDLRAHELWYRRGNPCEGNFEKHAA